MGYVAYYSTAKFKLDDVITMKSIFSIICDDLLLSEVKLKFCMILKLNMPAI